MIPNLCPNFKSIGAGGDILGPYDVIQENLISLVLQPENDDF